MSPPAPASAPLASGSDGAPPPALSIEDLVITLPRRNRRLVDGVSLHLARGEAVSIVGESGSGKSLTARAAAGLLPDGLAASGSIRLLGREMLAKPRAVAEVRGVGVALVLQNPFTMLSPVRKIGAQIADGIRDRTADHREVVRERLAEVGINRPEVADMYPFELSGGMCQRAALAAALAPDPAVLIADEPTTALDVTTQRGVLRLVRRLQESRGMSLLLITHDLRVALSSCKRVYVMYGGRIVESCTAAELNGAPQHPYTLGLLGSEPPVDRRVAALSAMPGRVPSPDSVAGMCAFAPRCRWATAECESGRPPLRDTEGRAVACIRVDALGPELMRERQKLNPGIAAAGFDESSGPSLLEVREARKVFPDGTHALKGVSIRLRPGDSVGLVGESGSGKTTLARCVANLDQPTSGRIEWSTMRDDASAVQVVFQDPYSSLNPAITIGTTLKEAARAGRQSEMDPAAAVAAALEDVGLDATYAGRKPRSLSGGELQRAAVARALIVHPQLVICDEPVSALDVSVQAQVLNLLNRLRRDRDLTILFITHDLAVVRQVADYIYVMKDGEVVEQGPTAAVLDEPRHAYTRELLESLPSVRPSPAG